MKFLAIIPARGGSKRIPNKNMEQLAGCPLVGWSIDCAKRSAIFSSIIVSTDSEEIFHYTEQWASGAHPRPRPIMRPPEIAADGTPMEPVVEHALQDCIAAGVDPDIIMLLQPTSPFRSIYDVKVCAEHFSQPNVEAVVSVTTPIEDSVFGLMTTDHGHRMTSQPQVVVPNGAIFAIRRDSFHSGHGWFGPNAYAHFMPKDRSLDIDNLVDIDRARALVEGKAPNVPV